MKIGYKVLIVFLTGVSLQSCMLDLRTKLIKKDSISESNITKGKNLLNQSWNKMGFDKFDEHQVYSYKAHDTWQGMLGKMALIWPEMESNMAFKYEVGTFNGQALFNDGAEQDSPKGFDGAKRSLY